MVLNLRGSEGRVPAAGFSRNSVSLTSNFPHKWQPAPPRGATMSCLPSAAHCGVLLQDPFVLDWSTKPLMSLWLFSTLSFGPEAGHLQGCVGLRGTVQHIPTLISRPPGQNHIQTHPGYWLPSQHVGYTDPCHNLSQFVCLTSHPYTRRLTYTLLHTYFEFPSSGLNCY